MARFVLNSQWAHYSCAGVLAAGIFISVFRWFWFDHYDPLHCVDLVTRGRWLDNYGENWQPKGCMLHSYSSKDALTCLNNQSSIFIGDSISRKLFFAFMHLVDPALPEEPPLDNPKHSDFHYPSTTSANFTFIWDPYLNSSKLDKHLSPPVALTKPFLLSLGSGMWYLRYAETSGGPTQWQTNTKAVIERVYKHSPAKHTIFLPVEKVVPSKLSEDRASSLRLPDIDAMNSYLQTHLQTHLQTRSSSMSGHEAPEAPTVITFPTVFNDILAPSQTTDGLHYSKIALTAQANILLNRLCNNALPKTYPFDKTCCRSYPHLSPVQMGFLILVSSFGFLALFINKAKYIFIVLPTFVLKLVPTYQHSHHAAVVGSCIGLLFMADRTTVFLKEQKQFNSLLFGASVLLTLAVGLLKVETSKDQSFLNRSQTDEWKGWMQVIILIYHYLGASKIAGIYNPIRVLVASYLFMTGYGHCSFYLKKADFSFLRIAQVLIRLNLLTILLSYSMNTNYFDYYFAPMVSFWFLVIYITMICGSGLNDRLWFILMKLPLSGAAVHTFFNSPWLLGATLDILHKLAKISWSPKEVAFRINLDLWIVYIGMLCAIFYLRFKDMKVTEQQYWHHVNGTITIVSGLGFLWFMYFQLSQPSKFTYNRWHPLISWIPILSFVALRNSSSFLRSTYSIPFAFVGTCSLETFIIQFHFWLAADTKGILLMLPSSTWRSLNVTVTTLSFIWISHQVAESTAQLTGWICGISKKTSPRTAQVLPGSTTENPINLAEMTALPEASRWEDRLSSARNSTGLVTRLRADIRYRVATIICCFWALNLAWPPPS